MCRATFAQGVAVQTEEKIRETYRRIFEES
jgi:hypothetical protein